MFGNGPDNLLAMGRDRQRRIEVRPWQSGTTFRDPGLRLLETPHDAAQGLLQRPPLHLPHPSLQ